MAKTSSLSSANPPNQFGFTTPNAIDWLKSYTYKPSAGLISPDAYGAQNFLATGSSVSPEVKSKEDLAFEKILKLQQLGAQLSANTTRQQLSDLYPYLSAASAEATARNLGASTQFLLTKEQTPTAQALRNQIAQGQIATAASSEALRDQAVAQQWLAAGQGPAKYSGTTFRMA
jgi:hypothetical protein